MAIPKWDYLYGEVGYNAYCSATGGKSLVTGDSLPAWVDLAEEIQKAWGLSARAILEAALGE
jgi:hypothetical protein